MHTEENAKSTWCPFADFLQPRDQAAVEALVKITTQLSDGTSRPRCIASTCSQWRWQDAPAFRLEREDKFISTDAVDYAGFAANAMRSGWTLGNETNEKGWVLYFRWRQLPIAPEERRGFCGRGGTLFTTA